MAKSIRVNTESINRMGYRILSAGIMLKYFLANPVMFYNHHRTWRGDKSEMLPIGRWENLRIEKGVLLADPVFDENDEFAKKIKSKFDNGFLNAASVGVSIIETSEDPKYLLPGQKRATVTKCELKEISIVDVPGNAEAVVVNSDTGAILELGDKDNGVLPIINKEEVMENNLKTIAVALALSENSSETEILSAINSMKSERDALKNDNATLKDSNSTFVTQKAADDKAHAERIVDSAITAKKIKKTERDNYLKLAEGNIAAVENILGGMQPQRNLADNAGAQGAAAADSSVTFDSLQRNNPEELTRLRNEEPEEFKRLLADHKKKR